MSIPAALWLDEERCTNCHHCVAACPVKESNDASGDVVRLDVNQCIGCARCVRACPQDARVLDDELEKARRFFSARDAVAIVAPAAFAALGDDAFRLISCLRSRGARAVFDVSWGAELATHRYLEYIRRDDTPGTVISQACPAVAEYVEARHPELIPYLARVESPMMQTLRVIDNAREFSGAPVVVISPCTAKKREFARLGLADRIAVITITSVLDSLAERGETLSAYEPSGFDGGSAERAVEFSRPGGLRDTIEREHPDAAHATRVLESDDLFEYFKTLKADIDEGIAPILVDGLNCAHGCNRGPGAATESVSLERIELRLKERLRSVAPPASAREERKRVACLSASIRALHREAAHGEPRYEARESDFPTLSEEQLDELYARLEKRSPEDVLNCAACGYGECKIMAQAISVGKNRPENCHHVLTVRSREQATRLAAASESLSSIGAEVAADVAGVATSLEEVSVELAAGTNELAATITELSAVGSSLKELSTRVAEQGETVVTGSSETKDVGAATARRLEHLVKQMEDIGSVVSSMQDFTEQVHILSMNAAVQAARAAGPAGASFAVIAREIGDLAEQSRSSASQADQTIREIREGLSSLGKAVDDVGSRAAGSYDAALLIREHGTAALQAIIEHSTGLDEASLATHGNSELAQTISGRTTDLKDQMDRLVAAIDRVQEEVVDKQYL